MLHRVLAVYFNALRFHQQVGKVVSLCIAPAPSAVGIGKDIDIAAFPMRRDGITGGKAHSFKQHRANARFGIKLREFTCRTGIAMIPLFLCGDA